MGLRETLCDAAGQLPSSVTRVVCIGECEFAHARIRVLYCCRTRRDGGVSNLHTRPTLVIVACADIVLVPSCFTCVFSLVCWNVAMKQWVGLSSCVV